MAMGGAGLWAIAVMWSLTGVTFIFVALRVYARAIVVKWFGIDDHVYNLAFVCRLFDISIDEYVANCRLRLRYSYSYKRYL